MMVAWAGMAFGGYVGGVLLDVSLSYTLSFALAGMSGVFNLAVLGALAAWKNSAATPVSSSRPYSARLARWLPSNPNR
jgi:hypothetical protein